VTNLGDLNAFVSVARAGGFREAARATDTSASGLSEAVRRLETQLGIRLLNRTTRSVAPTEAGKRLLERLSPALTEVESALDVVNSFRDKPAGTLRLNVPISAARLVLPGIVWRFLAAYPDIRLEVVAEDSFVDVLAAGFDAGIRYEERLEQDMIAVPIGPRTQRFAAAAAPAFRQRRARACPRTVVAALLGTFSLLLRSAPGPCAAPRVHRFHQGIGAASRIADTEAQALPCGLAAHPRAEPGPVNTGVIASKKK
jgi:DNA-binding transcriptional LysR family regulator